MRVFVLVSLVTAEATKGLPTAEVRLRGLAAKLRTLAGSTYPKALNRRRVPLTPSPGYFEGIQHRPPQTAIHRDPENPVSRHFRELGGRRRQTHPAAEPPPSRSNRFLALTEFPVCSELESQRVQRADQTNPVVRVTVQRTHLMGCSYRLEVWVYE